ncbi:MAG: hypothetical protein AAGC46_15475 [Solirubrobacteraceae bacterium]|nr:hypothetical protein [Patulibacter sp.]
MSVTTSLRSRFGAAAAIAAAAVAMLAAPAAHASTADLQVVPPGVPAYGQTPSQFGASWWKFVVTKPAPVNPLTDTTGANCAVGQSGLVWYLTGSFPDAGPITRSCTIPFGKAIVIPVSNGAYFAFPDDPAAQRTEAYIRSQVTPVQKTATNLKASIDGSAVTNPARFFEQSTVFSATLPANNIYGADAGQVLSPAVDAGYYLIINPLLPGKHQIKVSSTIPGAGSVDVTYNITTSLFG